MVTMKNRLVALIAMVAVVTGLSSCLKNNVTPPAPYTVIALINGATTPFGMDFYLNAKKENTAAITMGLVGVVQRSPKIYKVDFTKAGGDSLLSSLTANFDTSKYHTILIYGNNPVKTYNYKENFTTISQSKANVRFLNMVENSTVDFYINATKVSPGRQWEDFLGNMSFLDTDAANVTFTVKDATDGTELATYPDAQLRANYVYSIVYMGIKGNTGDRKPVIKILPH